MATGLAYLCYLCFLSLGAALYRFSHKKQKAAALHHGLYRQKSNSRSPVTGQKGHKTRHCHRKILMGELQSVCEGRADHLML
jgi:hypothetical protein